VLCVMGGARLKDIRECLNPLPDPLPEGEGPFD
jgi:hypothetical protein